MIKTENPAFIFILFCGEQEAKADWLAWSHDKNLRPMLPLFPTTYKNYKHSIARAHRTLLPEPGYRPAFQKEIHYGH